MTLILGISHGIYGDRKVTSDDGSRCEPLVKVAKNDFLVAGFAGDFNEILKALDAVREGESDPRELARIDIDGIVIKDGRIFLIDGGKAWLKRKGCGFIATGTGHAEATSYLSGVTSITKKVTDKSIRAAFRFVARVRDDCGRGIDYLPG